jgi:selT/selW/selH-like putative selenoprotein
MTTKPRITIHYCTQCSWLLRSAWMAQELLSTFGADLGEVALIPGTGGIFEIHVNGDLIWERKRDGGFPEAKVLKQKVRDIVWPERDLGHSDGHKAKGASFDKLRMRDEETSTNAPHGGPVEPKGGADGVPASDEPREELKGGVKTP